LANINEYCDLPLIVIVDEFGAASDGESYLKIKGIHPGKQASAGKTTLKLPG
jgi:hypothetical protein